VNAGLAQGWICVSTQVWDGVKDNDCRNGVELEEIVEKSAGLRINDARIDGDADGDNWVTLCRPLLTIKKSQI